MFEGVDVPCLGAFHFSYIADYMLDFCPLSDPSVGPCVLVRDVEHTSFHFGLCDHKFVLCSFGQCPCICLFRQMTRLLLKISQCLEHAAQPAMILQ